MRGVKSQAMVLAASNDDHSKVRKDTRSLNVYQGVDLSYQCFKLQWYYGGSITNDFEDVI